MIAGVRKIPTLRYFLIILLISALSVSAFYLYLHYKRAKSLRYSISKLINERENSVLIDSCILKLYSADNNSRLYTVTGNKAYLKKFSTDIAQISDVIDKIKFSAKDIPDADPDKFKALMKEKTEKTNNYIKLRLLTDSLIKSSIDVNRSLSHIQSATVKPIVKVEQKITIDTIRTQEGKPKKKFLGRLLSAFSNKKEDASASKRVVVKDTVTTTVITAKNNNLVNKASIKKYYNKLNDVNDKLRSNEQQILLINNNLIEEIIASLRLYQSVEQIYMAKSKADLRENLAMIYSQFSKVSIMNFIFLISLLILVFYNIWKIFKNEQEIIFFSEKAEQYATSKSSFLAGMSHEIRTPLNSIIGFSEQLAQSDLTTMQQEQISAIRNSSDMLLELVNEILDFSKYETGKMNFENSPFMLESAIEDVFTSMHIHAIKKKLVLENKVYIDDKICCIGDKMRLKQVIMNLIGNAIKFTVKGKVTLTAYVEKKQGDNIVLKVKITDTGLGIEKNNLPHIFEEFSQVEDAQKATRHKGTGLGLAICKKIIELQGGSINVNSEPGIGSVFSFELPLKQCEINEQLEVETMSDELMAELVKDKYVLFAEDNQFNVLLGSTILKKWGINYDVALNGLEALHLFEKNNYDVILTDIQMPEMNGLELTGSIRNYSNATKSNVPILALTANVMKEDRDIYLKAGINDLVLKPFLEKNLIEKTALAIQNNTSVLRFVS